MADEPSAIELLRGIASLRHLQDDQLARIAAVLTERSVGPGEVLLEEGTPGDESFLIAAGDAVVVTDEVPIARVGPGDFVGELALLTASPRGATVRAETPMRVLVLDRPTLRGLIDPITEALLGTMARRLQADDAARSARPTPTGPGRWTVGTRVAVRSRFTGTWVEGFEIAEVDTTEGTSRFQVRRRTDGAVLPVSFTVEEIRGS